MPSKQNKKSRKQNGGGFFDMIGFTSNKVEDKENFQKLAKDNTIIETDEKIDEIQIHAQPETPKLEQSPPPPTNQNASWFTLPSFSLFNTKTLEQNSPPITGGKRTKKASKKKSGGKSKKNKSGKSKKNNKRSSK